MNSAKAHLKVVTYANIIFGSLITLIISPAVAYSIGYWMTTVETGPYGGPFIVFFVFLSGLFLITAGLLINLKATRTLAAYSSLVLALSAVVAIVRYLLYPTLARGESPIGFSLPISVAISASSVILASLIIYHVTTYLAHTANDSQAGRPLTAKGG